MQDFVYQSAPMRVVFGTGAASIARRIVPPRRHPRHGAGDAAAEDLVAGIREMIGERFAGVFTGAVMHTPSR